MQLLEDPPIGEPSLLRLKGVKIIEHVKIMEQVISQSGRLIYCFSLTSKSNNLYII